MIKRKGPTLWSNVHCTHKTNLKEIIEVDNLDANSQLPKRFDLLKHAANQFELLIGEARTTRKKIRALGSGWALTDIAITDDWLVDTKKLNGYLEIEDAFFDASYSKGKRPFTIVAQCGVSVGELNYQLEVVAPTGVRRSLKTTGIGAGQTVAGAISGNTHGAAINFGSTPDYVVGIHLVTGKGKSLWIERHSYPVVNQDFIRELNAELIRSDDVFNSALVSFGAFGIIAALAIETLPLYELAFTPVTALTYLQLQQKLTDLERSSYGVAEDLYHFEFVFDPSDKEKQVFATWAFKREFQPGHPTPVPRWQLPNEKGYALGDKTALLLYYLPYITKHLRRFQLNQYLKKNILDDVNGTPGQLFTATVTYLEGFIESTFAIPIRFTLDMIAISASLIEEMELPIMSQVRVVHPTNATLAFTSHHPKTVIVEFGIANDRKFPEFEQKLGDELTKRGIPYTLHWSKNAGIDEALLTKMYGVDKIRIWKQARELVFGYDKQLMKVFANEHLVRCGLHQ